MKKDVRIEVKVRNNLILSRMEELGIGSIAELCRQLNETRTEDEPRADGARVGLLVNMRESARGKNDEWTALALRLSSFFRCMPEDLFSEPQQYNALEKNRAHAEVSFAEIQQLTRARPRAGDAGDRHAGRPASRGDRCRTLFAHSPRGTSATDAFWF